MRIFNISEARMDFSILIEAVGEGEEILIAKAGKVIPPFLKRSESRDYAAKASFCFGVMPPMAMLGRS